MAAAIVMIISKNITDIEVGLTDEGGILYFHSPFILLLFDALVTQGDILEWDFTGVDAKEKTQLWQVE